MKLLSCREQRFLSFRGGGISGFRETTSETRKPRARPIAGVTVARAGARTKLLRIGDLVLEIQRAVVVVHKDRATSSSPFTCWRYANSGIRDRTRPTAIGIQIQIPRCEGIRARCRSYLSASLAETPVHLSPLSTEYLSLCEKERERRRQGRT